MAVKSIKEGNILKLEIDNGDLEKLDQVADKWRFKDYQSLLRFAISILILSEEKSVTIKKDGVQKNLIPAADLIKDAE